MRRDVPSVEPYWGLRDYGTADQIGLEPTLDDYIANLVRVFDEVWRVLRDDGTLWLNLGDAYANDSKWGGDGGNSESKNYTSGLGGCVGQKARRITGFRPKNLMGIPWRVAFALQDAGWNLKQDIIWEKPNAMSEPVRDRCTKSHEYVFLLSKKPTYFYDSEAIKEPSTSKESHQGRNRRSADGFAAADSEKGRYRDGLGDREGKLYPTRNLRSVWTISTQGFKGSHFAVFPQKLASRCILAGTSAKGCCPECGSPWTRIVERERIATRPGTETKVAGLGSNVVGNRDPLRHVAVTKSIGWEPSCKCGREDVNPCVVLDPFSGAGSAGVAAVGAGRRYIGVEINPEYAAMAERRISRPHADVVSNRGVDKAMPLFADAEEGATHV